MKKIRYSRQKDLLLKNSRGISFDEILKNWELLKNIPHPWRENQKIMIYKYKNYPYCIPYVEEEDYIFLKTIFPNRKFKI